MSINNMINCVVHLACQSETQNKHYSYVKLNENKEFVCVDKQDAKLNDLDLFIQKLSESITNMKKEDLNTVKTALQMINGRIVKKMEPNFLTKIWLSLFGGLHKEELTSLHNKINNVISQIDDENNGLVLTNQHARCKFFSEFKDIFSTTPKALTRNEAILVENISKKIWDSKNIQNLPDSDKYAEYKKLMTEFYIGTHMLFEEEENNSLLNTLSTNAQVEERYSSHYGRIGGEKQHHIRGAQIPEALFHEGFFAVKKADNKPLVGKYFKNLTAEQQSDAKAKKFFWIQTERTPDGPDLKSLIYHRTVDFVQYIFLKHVLRSERPQIATYKAAQGRGLPDSNPIVVELNAK